MIVFFFLISYYFFGVGFFFPGRWVSSCLFAPMHEKPCGRAVRVKNGTGTLSGYGWEGLERDFVPEF